MARTTSADRIVTFPFVLNIHPAPYTFLPCSFLANGERLPVPGGLLALGTGGKRLPLSLKKRK